VLVLVSRRPYQDLGALPLPPRHQPEKRKTTAVVLATTETKIRLRRAGALLESRRPRKNKKDRKTARTAKVLVGQAQTTTTNPSATGRS